MDYCSCTRIMPCPLLGSDQLTAAVLLQYAIGRLVIPSKLDPALTSEPLICVRNPHGAPLIPA